MEPRLLLSVAAHPSKAVTPKNSDTTPVVHLTGTIDRAPVTTTAKRTTTKVKSKAKTTDATPSGYGYTSPYGGITPAQMQGAYLGTNFNFAGITGDGSGQTIAIIDAYDDPGLVNSTAGNFATSDLAEFDAYYHLPNPVFTKYGVSGSTVSTTLPAVSGTPYDTTGTFSWEIEESLDVEWAHVMAPDAKIVLIEAVNSSIGNLFHAVVAAEQVAGVGVVSMSFGVDESSAGSQGIYDSDMDSASGITFLAAAGDDGAYGSGIQDSNLEPQYPADSPYAVAVGGTSLTVSGTSWASETTWGNGTSSGSASGGGGGVSLNEPIPAYQTSLLGTSGNRQYPDISLDANTNTGVPVYDTYDFGATTPWVPGTVGGTSLATPLMAGIVAVADQGRALDKLAPLNSNGLSGGIDVHSLLYSLAGSSNSYAADFHDITTGNATGPAGKPPSGFSPETGYDLASGLGSPVAGRLVFDLSGISSTLAVNQPVTTSLYFEAVSSGGVSYTDIWVNAASPGTGTPTYQFVSADISSYTVTGGNISITFANVPAAGLTIGTGTDSLAVNGGAVTVTPQTPGGGILTRNFSSISVASGASLIFSTAPLHTDRTLVETSTLSLLGQLDLGGNDMIIHNGNLAAITALLAAGYAGGQWNGQGIASAAAHGDTTHTTALGAIQNTLYGGTGQPTFDGTSPLTTDVLVKYTYYGDTNLDGKVDGTDYSRIDNAYLFGGTGWFNGDFNYDNHINGSDYTLIDNAFNMQASPL
jgi:subtilase family serine protease